MGREPDAARQGSAQSSGQRRRSAPTLQLLIDLLLVGLGGGAGALARFLLTEVLPASSQLVTLGINVSGAFFIGVLVASLASRRPQAQLLLGTGLLGGFTTYSLFALQVAELARSGAFALALAYGIGTVVLGFAATLLGVACGSAARRLLRHRA